MKHPCRRDLTGAEIAGISSHCAFRWGVSSRFGHRKLHESHGTASEGVSLDRSGSFAQEFFEFLEDRLSREFHSATLRVEATEETPWV